MADRKQLIDRLGLVEQALADYMLRFGATELARIAMIRSVIDEMAAEDAIPDDAAPSDPELPPWLIDATRKR
ncbi:hypothetical protein [Neotabrizicola sp. VNH66]|uniref:hypothetical protein n=1 Tax=Neotabrizicola sp. VNH66 TaxID=3400918 RepID=UPI003C04C552